MAPVRLPAPRPVLWPLRPLESASVTDELARNLVDIEVEVERKEADTAVIAKHIAGGRRLINEFKATRTEAAYVTRVNR
jgi:hypothetical protein